MPIGPNTRGILQQVMSGWRGLRGGNIQYVAAVITDITVVPTMPGSPRGHRIKLFTKQIGKLLRVIKHLCQTGFISGNHITY